MLADEACRRESPTAICRRAGYAGTAAWSKAMRDPRFVAAVEALGVVVREKHGRTNRVVALLPPDGWSAPERRPLSVRALCALAGLKGSRPWYQALKNPRFVEEAGALGMPVQIVETWRQRQAAEWSVSEQRLLAVLQAEAHRERPPQTVAAVCRQAGYQGDYPWYLALANPRFAAVARELAPALVPTDERPWSCVQRRFLDLLAREEHRAKPIAELCRLLGYQSASSYREHLDDPRFVAELARLGVPLDRLEAVVPHIAVTPAPDLEEAVRRDVWDIRRLKADYPKHKGPHTFRLDFGRVADPTIREQLKGYFRARLPHWHGSTFRGNFDAVVPPLNQLPPGVHLGTLERAHIAALLLRQAAVSESLARRGLLKLKAMLEYMATAPGWTGPRPERFLVWPEDIPARVDTQPRPIPPDVVAQRDALVERAEADLAADREPPILKVALWNAVIILRRTGMRFADLAHLKAPDAPTGRGCLLQDADGYWWVRIDPDNTKTRREHRIPTRQSDGTIAVIRRQQALVADIPDHFGWHYLFRTPTRVLTDRGIASALRTLGGALTHEGHASAIGPHQFRHTIATDMIEQGVDVYTVKEFLGHASLRMTEQYSAVYKRSLKAKYEAYRRLAGPTAASELIAAPAAASRATDEATTDGGWVAGRVGSLYRSPLPDGKGDCVHLALLDPCPTPPICATCAKLRATRRHLPHWESFVVNLRLTVEALGDEPRWARARQRHEQELRHAEYVVETITREGFWDGRVHNTDAPSRSSPSSRTRAEQCRLNARAKSERKRQATL